MHLRLLGPSSLRVACVIIFLASSPTAAAPINYALFDTDSLEELGWFTVDPTLAAPVGISHVDWSAFSITETVGTFGPLTATQADLSSTFPNPPHASFFNGQIAAVSANSPGELPGGILFNIDMVPEDSPVDLNFVAIFQFTAWVEPLGDDGPDSGPIRGVGIRAATTTVPEPSTMLLFSIAAGASGIGWRRRRQAVSSHLVSEPPNARS